MAETEWPDRRVDVKLTPGCDCESVGRGDGETAHMRRPNARAILALLFLGFLTSCALAPEVRPRAQPAAATWAF